jgi:hypothetical protein
MLPQTNDPEEIQKCFLDLLQKVNQVSDSAQANAASVSAQVSSVQTLDNVVYFSAGLYIPTNAPNALYVMQGEVSPLIITLPSRAASIIGAKYTFRNASTSAHSLTVSTASGDMIGSTTSTSFVLYARDDFVTLENDGLVWSVVSTSGPIITALQSGAPTVAAGAWADIGSGGNLKLTLPPGVWNITTYFTALVVGSGYSNFAFWVGGVYGTTTTAGITSAVTLLAPFALGMKITLTSPTLISIACYSTPNQGKIDNASGSAGQFSAQRLA